MQFYNFTDFPFDFNVTVFYKLHLNEKASAGEIESEILDWLRNMPDGKTANWVVSILVPNPLCCGFHQFLNHERPLSRSIWLHFVKKRKI